MQASRESSTRKEQLLTSYQQMSSLDGAKAAFMKRLQSQPIIKKQLITPTVEEEEKPAPKPQTATPYFYSAATVSLNRQVFDIITLLREEDRPLDNNEIIRKLAIDVSADPELMQKLKENERITYDEITGCFVFKPRYFIRTPEGMLNLLHKVRGQTGMEVKELKESYASAAELVEELSTTRRLLLIRHHKDNSPRVVYYNDPSLEFHVSQDIQTMWHDIKIPYDMNLARELEKAGLQSMQVEEDTTVRNKQTKKTKKRKIRFNLTNKHLEDIDLKNMILPK